MTTDLTSTTVPSDAPLNLGDHIWDSRWNQRLIDERRRRGHLFVEAALHAESTRVQANFFAACEQSVWFYLDLMAWSRDPRNFVESTPRLTIERQRQFISILLGFEYCQGGLPAPLVVDKPRDTGVTDSFLDALVWAWLFRRGTKVGLLTLGRDECDNKTEFSLFGKMRFKIGALPPWMRPPLSKEHDKMMVLINPWNANTIVGHTTTGRAFRSSRAWRLIVDEAAFIPELEPLWQAISQTTLSPCYVSNPNGLHNTFGQLVHGKKAAVTPYPPPAGWLGYVHFRFTLADDPRKGEVWHARADADYAGSPLARARELGVSYDDNNCSGRTWPEFDRHAHIDHVVVTRELYGKALHVEGWDFGCGSGMTARVSVLYWPKSGAMLVYDYHVWYGPSLEEIFEDLRLANYCIRGRNVHHGLWPIRVADNFAVNARGGGNGAGGESWAWGVMFARAGLRLALFNRHPPIAIERVRERIMAFHLRVSPACAQVSPNQTGTTQRGSAREAFKSTLTDAMTSYHWVQQKNPEKRGAGLEKGWASHLADALMLAVCYALRVNGEDYTSLEDLSLRPAARSMRAFLRREAGGIDLFEPAALLGTLPSSNSEGGEPNHGNDHEPRSRADDDDEVYEPVSGPTFE